MLTIIRNSIIWKVPIRSLPILFSSIFFLIYPHLPITVIFYSFLLFWHSFMYVIQSNYYTPLFICQQWSQGITTIFSIMSYKGFIYSKIIFLKPHLKFLTIQQLILFALDPIFRILLSALNAWAKPTSSCPIPHLLIWFSNWSIYI